MQSFVAVCWGGGGGGGHWSACLGSFTCTGMLAHFQTLYGLHCSAVRQTARETPEQQDRALKHGLGKAHMTANP